MNTIELLSTPNVKDGGTSLLMDVASTNLITEGSVVLSRRNMAPVMVLGL